MKEFLMTSDYDGEEINDINEDIMESLNRLSKEHIDKYGLIKGKIRISVTHLSEDDCDCEGFHHNNDCPHWVMPY